MSRNDENKRIMAIDYLKAIAVILVILTHALSKNQRLQIGGPFWISMAVPIFMIISGFTNTLSADKNNINSFGAYFSKERIGIRLRRILIPYFIIILLEFFFGLSQKLLLKAGPFLSFGLKDYVRYFLTGGTTPGSYYVLILLQFVFVYPFMLLAYKKSAKKALFLFFSVHFLFDALANYLPISGEIYRILIFRYLAFIIMGVVLYYSATKIKKVWKGLALVSLFYIRASQYGNYVPQVFSKWTNTSLPTVFWALALVILGMKYLEKENTYFFTHMFTRIGQASYQIFLVQKILFGFGLNKLLRLTHLPILFRSILAISLCCFLGIVFHDRLVYRTD